MGTNGIPVHLLSTCCDRIGFGMEPCRRLDCSDMVRRCEKSGRWFVTMSHCGFNSKTNNGIGFSTEESARRSSLRILRATR